MRFSSKKARINATQNSVLSTPKKAETGDACGKPEFPRMYLEIARKAFIIRCLIAYGWRLQSRPHLSPVLVTGGILGIW